MAVNKIHPDAKSALAGVLRDGQGTALAFDILLADARFERVALPITHNLRRLGIDARVRVTDPVLYTQRVERFDYDMILDTFAQSASPGNEQRDMWTSAAATRSGGRNTIGLRDPAVDALVDAIIYAPDRRRLIAACRALDRVLQWNYFNVLHYQPAADRFGYWTKLQHPAKFPLYGMGSPDAAIEYWWMDPKAVGAKP